MKTELISIDFNKNLESQLKSSAELIKSGKLVAFPTETVYGLGASALDSDAAKKIYAAKGRPSDNPLIIHISCPEEAYNYCYPPESYKKLANAFLPGPLTIIMKKKNMVPNSVTANLDTVAVRCPENIVARELIRLSGVPIAAPSANLSGSPSPTTAQHCIKDLMGRVDAIIDGGECSIGLESTIIKLNSDESVTVLRPGAITPEMIREVIPNVDLDVGITKKVEINQTPLAPGMKYKHYAPKGQVYLLTGSMEKMKDFLLNKIKTNPNVGILCFDDLLGDIKGDYIVPFGDSSDQKSHAQRLFGALRYFDDIGVNEIYATMVQAKGLDLATYNRMLKASGYTIINL